MSMNHFQSTGGRAMQRFKRLGRLLSNGRNEGPPDLDELWRDFNRKLSGLFGGNKGGDSNGGNGAMPPEMKGAGLGLGLVGGLVVLAWLASGFFTVQEGQQAVITTFGKYTRTVDAGFQWRMPYPFQADEVVSVTQLQQVEVGDTSIVPATGLRDSSMLTEDENIVDIQFKVQYAVKDARDFIFNNAGKDDDSVKQAAETAVMLAAESAVREIVGHNKMDAVLYEQRDAIATALVQSIQTQLDRIKAGIVVKSVNMSSVQPPEQVQAAFDDAFKAATDRETLKNQAQAYANKVIPEAQGDASRLNAEAEGYKASVVATAEGDAQHFNSILAEYKKAPVVTRDRLYLDNMRQVFKNVTKVMVDSHNGSSLLYLPLDKLLQQGTATATPLPAAAPSSANPPDTGATVIGADSRLRGDSRGRDRDGR